MEDKTLICNIDMFAARQAIICPDGGRNEVFADNLATMLPAFCVSGGYTKIHFFGNEAYINGIVDELRTVEALVCGNKKIEIEVN